MIQLLKRILTRIYRRIGRRRHLRQGARGERYVARDQLRFGAAIVKRNWRIPLGELDLIVIDGTTLKIIEVKTRTLSENRSHFSPFVNITPSKLRKITRLTEEFCITQKIKLKKLRVQRIELIGAAVLEYREPWRILLGRGCAEIKYISLGTNTSNREFK